MSERVHALAEAIAAALVQASRTDLPLWLTPEDVSRETGFELETIANWRYKGKGPKYTKEGGEVRYPRAEFLAWLGEHPTFRSTTDESVRRAS